MDICGQLVFDYISVMASAADDPHAIPDFSTIVEFPQSLHPFIPSLSLSVIPISTLLSPCRWGVLLHSRESMTAENHVGAVEAAPLSMPSGPRSQKEGKTGDANRSVLTRSSGQEGRPGTLLESGFLGKCWTIISWTPKRCRWDPENPPKFSLALNLLFAFVRFILHLIYHTYYPISQW